MAANQEDVDEIEDIVGQVTYTDSQKSIPTTLTSSRVYSSDFTDSSEDRNNSSGKETYLVECDSEDSERTFPLRHTASTIIINDHQKKSVALNVSVQCANNILTKSTTTSLQRCSILAQETFTQTSKTIIELAEKEGMIKVPHSNSLQTQTSIMSITENKTVEYRIELSSAHSTFSKTEIVSNTRKDTKYINDTFNGTPPHSIDESTSKFPVSISLSEENVYNDVNRSASSSDQLIRILTDDSEDTIMSDVCNVRDEINTSNFHELSLPGSDMEEDSLRSDSPRSGNGNTYCDIKELRERLAESDVYNNEQTFDVPDIIRLGGTLTPLTEESNVRKESSVEISPPTDVSGDANHDNNVELLFTSNTGLKVKMMKNSENKKEPFKLPPINPRHHSRPNSPPLLNSLFNNNSNSLNKSGTLPSLFEKNKDRWEIRTKNLASGESPHIYDSRNASPLRKGIQLPPICAESPNQNNEKFDVFSNLKRTKTNVSSFSEQDAISIKQKIKELKSVTNRRLRSWSQTRKSERRSSSPGSISSPDRCLYDRGCDVVCIDLLKRLHSSSWHELMETLEEIPSALDKYWRVISEWRITDLIRKVTMLIESARPQVARTACKCLATILKNTNYTKKPDFHEAISSLLVKTGSYSRTVRRAANVALDDVICNVDLTHAVTALCVHGTGHKSGLVRCAAARLLVVSCALASGGRDLLRTRPATAVTARRHALRALSAMLDDKSADARKYAERLFSMLRPLSNFEAFYLTDVDMETATKQMKKYEQMLACGPPKKDR
ncbi:uncharacterized protein LOC113237791 isoform X2 [Hyposmocoma kahamanoa]|uniref:uncharacterized protein LOC113237791 isoform X2 n=1 Tax=Hyposmocoma kahamanoa TaxID=1477025 RepID=UPI000E6D81AE|nr:uncharacterized protein LOC113237791 isoform X2 [Hyposmocoma kahamanoa]